MPIIKSAKKALRQSEKRNKVNQKTRNAVRKAVKFFNEKITKESLSKAYSEIDKAVKKNLIHKNKAKRLKSSLSKKLKEAKKPEKKPTAGKTKTSRAKMTATKK